MRAELARVSEAAELSRNTSEIVTKSLGWVARSDRQMTTVGRWYSCSGMAAAGREARRWKRAT